MKILAWCTAIVLLVGAAVGLEGLDRHPASPPGAGRAFAVDGVEFASAASLQPFGDCDELLAFFREETLATANQGFGMGGDAVAVGGPTAGQSAAGARAEAAPGDLAAPAPATTGDVGADGDDSFSGTNLQEVDVDEPDVVKTNGDLIVAVAGGELHLVEPADDGPRLLGVAALPENASSELLLTGNRVTVLSRSYRDTASPQPLAGRGINSHSDMMVVGQPVTILTTVDISEPSNPVVVETKTFEGDYASARMTGTLARVVLRTHPDLGQPTPAVYEQGELDAWTEQAVDDAPLDAWLPSDDDGPVVACDAVARPAEPAGTAMITVLTIDVTASLEPQDATAVVANAETVYASTDRLYVSTANWSGCCEVAVPADGGATTRDIAPEPQRVTTDLHAFDTTGATTPYLGSGRVEGRLLNSFSLSEHEGTLRVATTIDSFDGRTPSESVVVTLAEEGGELVQKGRLAGLGTTEQIYAVRYQGDIGYVVTFRQTDPLYTIDLSDPDAPRLLGKLKIPGYSAYLHPAEDGRLIGVGQDATNEGRTLGSQVSTFDVTNLAAPVEEDRISFPGGWSPVEHEHRAFLWWAADRVAIVPMEMYLHDRESGEPTGAPFSGAVAVDVGGNGSLSERGRISHQGHAPADRHAAISRSLVIGDTLYTLSEAGILATDLATVSPQGWLGL
ncbi:MAG TPA: beta-propeller domain-containing protein [Acidimicrobiales bacterium]|nr:beta-propeller domain-containing protein [Acidimicrobiales bacterium]